MKRKKTLQWKFLFGNVCEIKARIVSVCIDSCDTCRYLLILDHSSLPLRKVQNECGYKGGTVVETSLFPQIDPKNIPCSLD